MVGPRPKALLAGLEVLPRKPLTYKDQTLWELDLDALIARRGRRSRWSMNSPIPNAPGSRHPKRYLDVEELLSHGIDVYTAVNIQHIESLNDVVAQITHVRVRETVPDSVFDRADAIELIDLTPDDLIQRLKEGKVYVPKQAERALEHYFSPGNLTALRELALRRTARTRGRAVAHPHAGPCDCRDRGRRVSGSWSVVSEDPRAAGLVRYAKRLADRLHAPFTAVQRGDAAQPATGPRKQRDRRRRYNAAGRSVLGARGDHASRRRRARHRRTIVDRLRAGQQRHPDHHRQVDARVALVRAPARLCRP